MQPTPKWNEELPLVPKPKVAPPRYYKIAIDKGKPVLVVISPQAAPKPPPPPKKIHHVYEIQGASLREDELREEAADSSPSKEGLYMNRRGQLQRIGEEVPSFPGGNVISRARLMHLWNTGQLRKPNNMVNSFPSGRLRKRKHPFDPRLSDEAASLVNPGAYHGISIPMRSHLTMKGVYDIGETSSRRSRGEGEDGSWGGELMVGRDGQIYRPGEQRSRPGRVPGSVFVGRDGGVYQVGAFGFVKKIGRGIKKGVKGVARGAKATGRFAKRHAGTAALLAVAPAVVLTK